jgi:hypothetical protein
LASSSASWDAATAASSSFFEVFLLRPREGDDERCPLVADDEGAAAAPSGWLWRGLLLLDNGWDAGGGADPPDLDADLDLDDEEDVSIRRGVTR